MFKPLLIPLPQPTRRRQYSLFLSVVAVSAALNICRAENQDFRLPITVDSKTQFVDGKRKTSIFKEDVYINQGSLKIQADEVEVNAALGEGKEIFIARGEPAVYSQTMEDGADIRAVAKEIKYQLASRTLTLTGAAELHQNSSMVKGNLIIFNLDKQQLLAEGQAGDTDRVVTVFRPESFKALTDKETKNN